MHVQCSASLKYKDNGYGRKITLKYKFKLPIHRFAKRKKATLYWGNYLDTENFIENIKYWTNEEVIKEKVKEKILNYIEQNKLDAEGDQLIESIKKFKNIEFEFDIKSDE